MGNDTTDSGSLSDFFGNLLTAAAPVIGNALTTKKPAAAAPSSSPLNGLGAPIILGVGALVLIIVGFLFFRRK